MPDGGDSLNNNEKNNDSGNNADKKRKFINEKVVKKQSFGDGLLKYALKLVISAVLFGVIAMAAAIVSKPFEQKIFNHTSGAPTESVTIPLDETSTEAVTETSAETSPETETEEETQPVEDIVKSAMEQYHYSMEDFTALYDSLTIAANRADEAVVVIHSMKTETDWFDNPLQRSGLYSGIAIAKTDSELIILTTLEATQNADSLKVTILGGTDYDATMKKSDEISGIAVLSVAIDDNNREDMNDIIPVALGNSYIVKRGDCIIAVGGPSGIIHSVNYGFITYTAKDISVVDGLACMLYSDVRSDKARGTWLINTNSELVGWIADDVTSEDSSEKKSLDSPSVAYGISEYKSIIEHLSNSQPIPYIGIKGTGITAELEEQNIPSGIYVTEVLTDSPAYLAGIQPGDILVSIGGEETDSIGTYINVISKLSVDEQVSMKIMRNGREEYKELEFTVTVGER